MNRRLFPRPIVVAADAPARPWQNGGGTARDLFAWPKPDQWRVRVTLAEIAADGPFSKFPGVQRAFAVVAGADVELAVEGALHRVRANGEPLVFAGRGATTCRRIGGNATALNLLLRGVTGSLRKLKGGSAWLPASPSCGFYAPAAGRCRFIDEEVEVPAQSLLWFDLAPPMLSFSADAWAFEVGAKTTPVAAAP